MFKQAIDMQFFAAWFCSFFGNRVNFERVNQSGNAVNPLNVKWFNVKGQFVNQ